MHTDDLSAYTHEHVFDLGNPAAERGTRTVMWVTAAMMVIEIAGGWWLNSMALLADGWHMSSHATCDWPKRVCIRRSAAISERSTVCVRDVEDRSAGRISPVQFSCWELPL